MPETSTREVNTDAEVIDADKIDDGETTEEELEEEVVPAVDEEAEKDPPEDDAKEPPESSPEGKKVIPEKEEKPIEPSKKEPTPVEGESPREAALRLQIQSLRTELRKKNLGITGEDKKPAPATSDRMKKLQETYSPEEIRNMEEAIDVLAESKGYVKSSQTYQETVNGVVDTFIEENPEYKPANDPEDARWTRFQEILKDGTYNLSGKTPKQLSVIFKRVKVDVDQELGEPAIAVRAKEKEVETRKIAAQTQKVKSVSHSGGTKVAPAKKESTIDPGVRAIFKDFSDEDLA